jgi:spermidine/putrescine transport system substrate-binding protein
MLLLSALAAGCGPASQPAAAEQPATEQQPAADQPQQTRFPVDRSRLVPELHVFHWSEYIDPAVYEQFEQEFGVKVTEDNYASNEDLLAKLQAGATGYDVIVPSDYMVAIMIELGMLAKLDKNNLPNLKNLNPKFTGLPYDPNGDYSVPYQWGTTGIGYRTDIVEEEITGWSSLFDLAKAEKYKGKISMLNDVREAMAAALKYKGYSLNSTEPAELEEAKALLTTQKPVLAKYDSESYNDDLVAGDLALAHGWSGDIFLAQSENENIAYVIPEEGGVLWVDNVAIPATATGNRKYTAEVFINYLLEPDIGAMITNFLYYASPNAAALPYINDEIKNNPSIYPGPEVMDRLELIRDVGEATALYDRLWTEIKSQ